MKTHHTLIRRLLFLMAAFPGIACSQQAIFQIRSQNLIGYSTGAKNQFGGTSQVIAAIKQGHNRLRAQFRNARTIANADIVGIIWFPGAPDGNISTALSMWRNKRVGVGRTGGGTPQATIERNRKVDVSSLMTRGSGSRGISGGGSSFYNVTRYPFIRAHTQGHEMGHNYTGTHAQGNRLAATSQNTLGFSRFTSLASGGQSVNAIIDYFSNPNVKFRGGRTGSSSRNNAARLRGRRFAVRNNRR